MQQISIFCALAAACLIQLVDSAQIRGGGNVNGATTDNNHERSLSDTLSAILYLRWGGDLTECLAYDGDDVKTGDCDNRNENKQWRFDTDGRLRVEKNTDKCVEVRDSDGKFEMKTCSDASAVFTYNSDYGVLRSGGKCAMVEKNNSGNNRIWLVDCPKPNDMDLAKEYRFIDFRNSVNINSAMNENKCIKLDDGNLSKGVELTSSACDNDTKKKWILDPDGYMHTAIDYDYCLDTTGSSPWIQVIACASASTWTWNQWGMLQEVGTLNCLADQNSNQNIRMDPCPTVGLD